MRLMLLYHIADHSSPFQYRVDDVNVVVAKHGEIFMGLRTLADKMRVSKDTANRTLRRLKTMDLIDVKKGKYGTKIIINQSNKSSPFFYMKFPKYAKNPKNGETPFSKRKNAVS